MPAYLLADLLLRHDSAAKDNLTRLTLPRASFDLSANAFPVFPGEVFEQAPFLELAEILASAGGEALLAHVFHELRQSLVFVDVEPFNSRTVRLPFRRRNGLDLGHGEGTVDTRRRSVRRWEGKETGVMGMM